MNNKVHSFHMVDISPYPLLMSFSLLSLTIYKINYLINGMNNPLIKLMLWSNLLLILYLWFRDVYRESKLGFHTIKVQKGLMLSFLIFLITEIKLFFSLFWTYLHSGLNVSIELVYWPPLSINSVNYKTLPFLNSILLLSGGFLCTWAHHMLLQGINKLYILIIFIIAILLTILFLYIQYIEYSYNEFTISDSVYGSIFYALTGLHMSHVLFAVLFLIFACFRIKNNSITLEHNLTLDKSLIYYHVVDVIWLLLFVIVYIWGN